MAPFILAFLCSALDQFLDRWYFAYQRSSPGTVDRTDDISCSLAGIVGSSFTPSYPQIQADLSGFLIWWCSPCSRAASGFLHTGAILSARGRWCLRQCALQQFPCRPVASKASYRRVALRPWCSTSLLKLEVFLKNPNCQEYTKHDSLLLMPSLAPENIC